MLQYPVDISQEDSDNFTAKLADLPDGPTGTGDDAYKAYMDLVDKSLDMLTEMIVNGEHPEPSDPDGRPVIGMGDIQLIKPEPVVEQIETTSSDGTDMVNYNWSSDKVFRDK